MTGQTESDGPGSRVKGFYRLGQGERLKRLALASGLSERVLAELETPSPLPLAVANQMVENVIGVFGLPIGVGLNFLVNGRDRLVPMVIEEPSVIAAASHAARVIREAGGFSADADAPVMIGQVQLVRVPNPEAAIERLHEAQADLLGAADAAHPDIVRHGGGARNLEVRCLQHTPCGPMLIVHLLVDVGDAMGANTVNTMVEAMAPLVEEITGGEARLRILSNLADHRLARASARIAFRLLDTGVFSGREIAERIMEAWAFAAADPYRAATHNKGIMNGIDAVTMATGNDWRAIEAGAHAYAARNGRYEPLSRWRVEADALFGTIELPLAVATIGGNLDLNPRVRLAHRLLDLSSARELAAVIAAVGLGQNFAAMRALVTEGIQRGHMALHARGMKARLLQQAVETTPG